MFECVILHYSLCAILLLICHDSSVMEPQKYESRASHPTNHQHGIACCAVDTCSCFVSGDDSL